MERYFTSQYVCWYKRGDYLHRNTDGAMAHIYYLHKGLAMVYRVSYDGQEELVRYVKTGTFIGAPALFTTSNGLTESDTSIRACTDCKVYKIPFAEFLAAARVHPEILERIIIEMSMETRYFRLLMTYIAGQRTANAFALLLANLAEETGDKHFISKYTTYTDMANYLKTHKITISKIVKKLVDLKVLSKKDGTLYIEDMAQLEAYAQGQPLIYWDKKASLEGN